MAHDQNSVVCDNFASATCTDDIALVVFKKDARWVDCCDDDIGIELALDDGGILRSQRNWLTD